MVIIIIYVLGDSISNDTVQVRSKHCKLWIAVVCSAAGAIGKLSLKLVVVERWICDDSEVIVLIVMPTLLIE